MDHQRRILALLVLVFFVTKALTLDSVTGMIVLNSGLLPFSSTSMALTFFAEVHHNGLDANETPTELELQGRLEIVSCCQYRTVAKASSQVFESPEADCESMNVFSGLGQWIRPGETRTLTAFFPTSHILNRVGSCYFRVSKEEDHVFEIDFNTVPTETLVKAAGLKLCAHLDHDPLKSCAPVSCLHKYNGYRSFFNVQSQTCVPTPSCIDEHSELTVLTAEEAAEYKPQYLDEATNECVHQNFESHHLESESTGIEADGATVKRLDLPKERLSTSASPRGRKARSDENQGGQWYHDQIERTRNRLRMARESRRTSAEGDEEDDVPGLTIYGISSWKAVFIAFSCILIIWATCALLNWRFQFLPLFCTCCDCDDILCDSNKKPAKNASKFKLVDDEDDDSDAIEEVLNRREKQFPKPGPNRSEETQTFRNVLKINESTSTQHMSNGQDFQSQQKRRVNETNIFRLYHEEPANRLPDVEDLLKKFNQLKKQSHNKFKQRPEYCDPKGQGDCSDLQLDSPISPRLSLSNSTQSFKPQPPSIDHVDSFTDESKSNIGNNDDCQELAQDQSSPEQKEPCPRKPFTVSRCCSPIFQVSVDGAAGGDGFKIESVLEMPSKPVAVDQATQYDQMPLGIEPLRSHSTLYARRSNLAVPPPIPPRASLSVSAHGRGSSAVNLTFDATKPRKALCKPVNSATKCPVSPPSSVSDLDLLNNKCLVQNVKEPVPTKKRISKISAGSNQGKCISKPAMKSQSSLEHRFKASPQAVEMAQAAQLLRRIVEESSASERKSERTGEGESLCVQNREEIRKPGWACTNPFLMQADFGNSFFKGRPIQAPSQLNLAPGRKEQTPTRPLQRALSSANSMKRTCTMKCHTNEDEDTVEELLNVELITTEDAEEY